MEYGQPGKECHLELALLHVRSRSRGHGGMGCELTYVIGEGAVCFSLMYR